MDRPKALPAILWGGLIAGTLDLTYALAFYGAQGVKLIRIPQSIASGLLGMESFKGGLATTALGVALQFTITFGAASVYYAVSRKLTFLTRRAIACGLLYGCAIYFFMHWAVLPLSAAPKFKYSISSVVTDFAVHMFFIGLPISLAVRRYSNGATSVT